jgi:hypothetical protein
MRLDLCTEYPPAGEQEHIDSLIRQLRANMEHDYAGKRVLRDAHPKMHGCVRGEFTVAPDLPRELAAGLFAESRSYPVWARFSNANAKVQPDAKGDIRGAALKLVGVEADFLLISDDKFVVHDVAEFDEMVAALIGGPVKMLRFLLTHPRAAINLFPALRVFENPLAIRYFSAVPYLLGDRAVKYCLTPREGEAHGHAPYHAGPDYLREAMVNQLAARDAVFDFGVQFQIDPYAMPIEDAGVTWDEGASPFHTLATLRIPAQLFDTTEQREFGDNLSFNPWRCLPEHRPLGGIGRARRQVYSALSTFRHESNHAAQTEPAE